MFKIGPFYITRNSKSVTTTSEAQIENPQETTKMQKITRTANNVRTTSASRRPASRPAQNRRAETFNPLSMWNFVPRDPDQRDMIQITPADLFTRVKIVSDAPESGFYVEDYFTEAHPNGNAFQIGRALALADAGAYSVQPAANSDGEVRQGAYLLSQKDGKMQHVVGIKPNQWDEAMPVLYTRVIGERDWSIPKWFVQNVDDLHATYGTPHKGVRRFWSKYHIVARLAVSDEPITLVAKRSPHTAFAIWLGYVSESWVLAFGYGNMPRIKDTFMSGKYASQNKAQFLAFAYGDKWYDAPQPRKASDEEQPKVSVPKRQQSPVSGSEVDSGQDKLREKSVAGYNTRYAALVKKGIALKEAIERVKASGGDTSVLEGMLDETRKLAVQLHPTTDQPVVDPLEVANAAVETVLQDEGTVEIGDMQVQVKSVQVQPKTIQNLMEVKGIGRTTYKKLTELGFDLPKFAALNEESLKALCKAHHLTYSKQLREALVIAQEAIS